MRGSNKPLPPPKTDRDRGVEAEEAFQRFLGKALRTTPREDIEDHIDLKITYDVKAIKEPDEFGNGAYHYIELMNVNGKIGWLYGKADFLAFELKDYWIIVERKVLAEFIESVVTEKTVQFTKEPYKIYRRKDRFDKVVMIPVVDLCYLGTMIKK
jgi:hypothetical protein